MSKCIMLFCCRECQNKYQRMEGLQDHYAKKHPTKTAPAFPSLEYRKVGDDNVCNTCFRKGQCDHKIKSEEF